MLAGSVVARTSHFAWHCAPIEALSLSVDATTQGRASDQLLLVTRDVWLGAMVPKRWAKQAVTRNAIKRQIYRMGRDFESTLPLAAHLVRLRAGFDRSQFSSATSDLLKSVVRLELRQLFEHAATGASVQCSRVSST